MHSLLRSAFEQWGKGKTFSIPFPAQCLHVVATYASTKSSDDNSDITVTATSTTGYITHKTYETFFLALGHQPQWGYSGYAVNFPISFDIVYNVLSIPQNTASTSNSYWGRFYITNLTKNGFTVSDTGAGSNRWLAIGKAQPQWGYVKSTKVTFPIQFNIIYTVLGNAHGSNNSNNDHYFLASFSTTEASFNYSNMNFTGLSWIAIGSA